MPRGCRCCVLNILSKAALGPGSLLFGKERWSEWKQCTVKDTQLALFNDRCLTDRIPKPPLLVRAHCGRMSGLLHLVSQNSLRAAEGLVELDSLGFSSHEVFMLWEKNFFFFLTKQKVEFQNLLFINLLFKYQHHFHFSGLSKRYKSKVPFLQSCWFCFRFKNLKC